MRKDKARDIARGVLPSTARKGARDAKRAYHSTHRSAQRQTNHAILRHLSVIDDDTGTLYTDPDLYDDFTDHEIFDGYHAATKKPSIGFDDMNEIVYDRRNADKLGPLISWARATEKNKMDGWEIADKIAYFKAVLPDTLQGRHALGHVQSALDLETDQFRYGYFGDRPPPYTLENFRADLARCLSTTKGRRSLHDFILETVPVAAHFTPSNNKVKTTAPAVDENGAPRYVEATRYINGQFRTVTIQPTVDVYVPQPVAATCDDCAFLRNDPLATTDAINRFVSIVWNRPRNGLTGYYVSSHYSKSIHPFLREIIDYVSTN